MPKITPSSMPIYVDAAIAEKGYRGAPTIFHKHNTQTPSIGFTYEKPKNGLTYKKEITWTNPDERGFFDQQKKIRKRERR